MKEIQWAIGFVRCKAFKRVVVVSLLLNSPSCDDLQSAERFFQNLLKRPRRENRRILGEIRTIMSLSDVPKETRIIKLLKIVKKWKTHELLR